MAGAVRSPQSLRAASARARREGNGFGHAQVAQIQRARILAAMFDVATEQGAENVSVAHVVERSGVSRRTFYEAFSDREDCFLAAFDDALAFASQRVLPAYASGKKWRERIRAGLLALLCFLDEEPVIGRLLICESLTGGARTLERRGQVLARVAAAIDEGRGESANAASLPPLTAEGLVGGALSVIHARIVRPGQEPPPMAGDTLKGAGRLLDLSNQLVSMIVLPYLGPAAARKELDRPIEPRVSDHRDARLLEDPFKGAGMRLTYRTVRVLLAVSELGGREPGPSNRTIGESAGMTDQGQISKLLNRLQRLGLISNTGLGPGQGAPNAWTLTGTGRQLTKSIRTHTGTPHSGGQAGAHTTSSQ
jgi:AcrR family transcriptional regulator